MTLSRPLYAVFTQSQVWTIAHKEWMDGRRNRWLQSITLLLFLLALGIAYLGGAVAGKVGFTGLSNTIVSLASLAVLIMPLIALLLSYDAIVGEDECGTLLLLSAYPISSLELFLGKWLGRSLVLGSSIIIGFGCAALVLAFSTETPYQDIAVAFSVFILSALLLGMSFLAIGIWISSVCKTRAQATGISLLVWFFAAVLFDLLVLSILVFSQGHVESSVLAGLLLANPTDIFRMVNFAMFADMQKHTGLMAVQQSMDFSVNSLLSLAFIWVLIPLMLAYRSFTKRTL